MKIITDHEVYVQKNDIAYLNQTDLAIPASIFMKVFGSGIVIIDDSNRFEFIKFDTPEVIDFFRHIDWILDYNEVKDLSEEQIITLGQNIAQEKNTIAKNFNSMSAEERQANIELVSQYELLGYKIYSLRDFLLFKQGYLKMELPNGLDLPVELKQEKGIQKIIKSIFNKRKH